MRIYVLLRVVRVFLSILCLLVGLITVIWDQLQVHRLKSTEDLHRLIQVHKLEKIDDRCRIVNSTHFQCLPNVFIIGASKAGTTSLVHYLRQLPRVHFVRRHISTHIDNHSEIHLFDRPNYGRSWKSIDMAVEWASCPIVPSTEDVVVHYTPHYLYAPSVPFDIKKIYPAVSRIKFIVLLRDPLERSLSSYWFKNSHLLKEVDSGNIQDFVAGAEAEKILRYRFIVFSKKVCISNPY